MKKVIALLIFSGFVFATKAQTTQHSLTYKQKRWLDSSLRSNRKQLSVTINPAPQLAYNMPLAMLYDKGKKIGMSGEDTIYQMKTDNMLLLKPNRNTTKIPNATDGKVFMVPPAKKPK